MPARLQGKKGPRHACVPRRAAGAGGQGRPLKQLRGLLPHAALYSRCPGVNMLPTSLTNASASSLTCTRPECACGWVWGGGGVGGGGVHKRAAVRTANAASAARRPSAGVAPLVAAARVQARGRVPRLTHRSRAGQLHKHSKLLDSAHVALDERPLCQAIQAAGRRLAGPGLQSDLRPGPGGCGQGSAIRARGRGWPFRSGRAAGRRARPGPAAKQAACCMRQAGPHLPPSDLRTFPATSRPSAKAAAGSATNESDSWLRRTRASRPRASVRKAPAEATDLTYPHTCGSQS